MSEYEPKSDAEYLAEHADWPHILELRASIIGQLALKVIAPIEPIKEELE